MVFSVCFSGFFGDFLSVWGLCDQLGRPSGMFIVAAVGTRIP